MFPSTTCMSSCQEFSFVCQCPGRTSMQKACCTVFYRYLTLCSLGESQNYKKTRSRTPNFCLSDLMPSIYQSILLTTAPSQNPAYNYTNKASCLPLHQQSILLAVATTKHPAYHCTIRVSPLEHPTCHCINKLEYSYVFWLPNLTNFTTTMIKSYVFVIWICFIKYSSNNRLKMHAKDLNCIFFV